MSTIFNKKTGCGLIVALLAAFAGGTSCSDDSLVSDSLPVSDQMSFDVSISDKWNLGESRAAENEPTFTSEKIENSDLWLITTVEDNPDTTLFERPKEDTRAVPIKKETFYDSFGVYAWVYKSDNWDTATEKQLYIGGDKVTEIATSGIWSFSSSRFWPGAAYHMKFFAYAPYKLTNMTVSESNCAPTISYTVITDVRNQKDLLATTTMMDAKGDYNQALNLEFKHILTAINVKGSDPFNRTITSVKFHGVKQSGTYTYGNGSTVWYTEGGDVTISCDELNKELGENETEVISDVEGTTFLMIPQELGPNAKIEVTFSDGKTLSASLTGKEWPIGKRVTYIISDSQIKGKIEAEELVVLDYYGGSKDFTVKSYVTTNGVNPIPAAWTAEFVREDDSVIKKEHSDYPNWLGEFDLTGNGGIEGESRTAIVPAQIGNVSNSHNLTLRSKQSINESTGNTPYDLSTKGGQEPMNTANCYIVNAPGTYSFPLVYGNAVKNGSEYSTAYTSFVNNKRVLKNFVNHDNAAIKSPYIGKDKYSNGTLIKTNDAEVVWQDVLNLVSNVSLVKGTSVEGDRIVFEVTKERIQQGNAVIAVLNDAGTVLWSWHIWVTDFVPLSDLQTDAELEVEGEAAKTNRNYNLDAKQYDKKVWRYDNNNSYTYTFMGVPLGFCHGETTTYASREVKVRFTQKGTGEVDYMTIRQTPKTITIDRNAPYYQWGRKDPVLPGSNSNNKLYYDKNGIESNVLNAYSWPSENTMIAMGIKNPQVYCTNTSMENSYHNLWDLNNDFAGQDKFLYTKTTKTVYDPSPVGYVIPHDGAYTGVTYNGDRLASRTGEYFQNGINSPYTSESDVNNNGGYIFYCRGMNKNRRGYNPLYGVIFYPGFGKRTSWDGSCDSAGGGFYTSATPYQKTYDNVSYTVHIHQLSWHTDLSKPDSYGHTVWPHLPNPKGEGLSVRPVRE